MANRWKISENSVRLYFGGLQSHCRCFRLDIFYRLPSSISLKSLFLSFSLPPVLPSLLSPFTSFLPSPPALIPSSPLLPFQFLFFPAKSFHGLSPVPQYLLHFTFFVFHIFPQHLIPSCLFFDIEQTFSR